MDKFIYEPNNKEFEENESIRRFFFNINGSKPNNYIYNSQSNEFFLIDGTPLPLSSLKIVGEEKEEEEKETLFDVDVEEGNQSHHRDDEEGEEQHHPEHKP